MHDPSLTTRGERQSRELCIRFPYHSGVEMLVSSPLRRALYTTILGFDPELRRGLRIVALPEIQETSDLLCDTGSDVETLKKEFETEGKVDLGLLVEGWNEKVSAQEKISQTSFSWFRCVSVDPISVLVDGQIRTRS